MKLPIIGEEWQHFKGDVYKVVDIVWFCDTELKIMIIYTRAGSVWCRTLANFLEPLDSGKRFTYHGP